MRFSSVLLAAAAFANFANAIIITNLVLNNVTAGKPFTIQWAENKGPVTITLQNGNRGDLQDVKTIASGETGKSFTWAVPATLPADTYNFYIKDSVGENWSIQFQLIGGATASVSSSASASSTSASAKVTTVTQSTASQHTTAISNLTTTRGSTRSSTPTSTGTGASTSPTSAPNGNGAGFSLTSNLAFVFLAVGALMTLN